MTTLLIFASDSTGLSAENMGLTLMSQFPGFDDSEHETISFIKTQDEAALIADKINQWAEDYAQVLVFTTFSDQSLQAFFSARLIVPHFDLFKMMLPSISAQINAEPNIRTGNRYIKRKDERAAAIDYALEYDDGQKLNFDAADIILIGLSRSGKTPTSLWLALHYGLKVANYPVTADDFDKGHLPENLSKNLHKCVLLLPSVERLHQLRQERYPNSKYSSVTNCESEIRELHKILKVDAVIDVSNKSIEEIAAVAIKLAKIHPKYRF